DSLSQEVTQVRLQSWVDVDFWLLNRDDLIVCRKALDDKREHLAYTEANIQQSDLDIPAVQRIYKPDLVQISCMSAEPFDLEPVTGFQPIQPEVRFLDQGRCAK